MEALEYVEYGVIGEGEITVCELCKALENEEPDLSLVEGIIYRENNQWIRNPDRKDIQDLDSLPFPDYEGFDFGAHLNETDQEEASFFDTRKQINNVYIIGSRSCPFNCTFCFHTCGKKYRQRSLDNIFEELDYLVERYKIKNIIGIQDELISYDKKRILEFCRRIKKYNLGWWGQFRVDTMDLEVLRALKDSNCQVMAFGIESADNRILKSMRKGTTIQQIETTLRLAYEAEMPFVGTFIFGDIEETKETAYNTINWWKEHMEYRLDLRMIIVYPGSSLYKYAIQKGLIKDPVQYLKDGCPQINISKLSDEEFGVLSEDIMRLPIENAIEFSSSHLIGRELITYCGKCGEKNIYKDVVFFIGSHLTCSKCGQKHNTSISEQILSKIEDGLDKLLMKYRKIAIWAINVHVNDLIKQSKVIQRKEIYLIDISNIKQTIKINGKQVYAPDIIKKEEIDCVIVGVSAYKRQIESRINEQFRKVKCVLDIGTLIYTEQD